MDLMQIRRGLLAQMAQSGANFVKGTFTVPSDASTPFTFDFGKSFEKYLFYIEISDEGKEDIIEETYAGRRAYAFTGNYPNAKLSEQITNPYNGIAYNYASSNQTPNYSQVNFNLTDHSITYTCGAFSANNASMFIKGYTYNYYIVEIK